MTVTAKQKPVERSEPDRPRRSDVFRLTLSAMTLAICLVSFTLFRGSTNILNALIVPLTLALCSGLLSAKQLITLELTLAVLVLILFPSQLVFILTYAWLAYLLGEVSHRLPKGPMFILYAVALSISFGLAIACTDALFGTRMQALLLGTLGQSWVAYSTVLLIEGLIVSFSHIWLIGLLRKRLLVFDHTNGH